MSRYELDDNMVRRFLSLAPFGDSTPAELAAELERQMPASVPTKRLALVVETSAGSPGWQFCLLDPGDGTGWFGPVNDPVNLGAWVTSPPRPFAVLFEGVDL